jgi:hypothetical protein
VCYDTQQTSIILGINENNYFQSCHASRAITRAGFESAPILTTICTSQTMQGRFLIIALVSSVGATHTKQPGLLLT